MNRQSILDKHDKYKDQSETTTKDVLAAMEEYGDTLAIGFLEWRELYDGKTLGLTTPQLLNIYKETHGYS